MNRTLLPDFFSFLAQLKLLKSSSVAVAEQQTAIDILGSLQKLRLGVKVHFSLELLEGC